MQVEDELTKRWMRCTVKMFLPGCGIISICDPHPRACAAEGEKAQGRENRASVADEAPL